VEDDKEHKEVVEHPEQHITFNARRAPAEQEVAEVEEEEVEEIAAVEELEAVEEQEQQEQQPVTPEKEPEQEPELPLEQIMDTNEQKN